MLEIVWKPFFYMLHNNSAVGLLRNARTAGIMDKHIIVIHLKPYVGYI